MKVSATSHTRKSDTPSKRLSDSNAHQASRQLHGAAATDQAPALLKTMPAVSMLHTSSIATNAASAQLKSYSAPIQFERKRKKNDSTATQLKKSSGVAQLVVADDVAANTKIIIDYPQAADFGDTGIVKRHSSVVPDCQAVEFDNEAGTEYRVLNYEMSPYEVEDEAVPSVFSMTARSPNGNVIITGTFSLGDPTSQALSFTATSDGSVVGILKLDYYGDGNFYLTNIKTNFDNVPKEKRVPGMGAALLRIAAEMAVKLKIAVIELVATRYPPNLHPALFYQRFGFASQVSLLQYDNDLSKYLAAINYQPVKMTSTGSDLAAATDEYLHGKWAFGSWRH